MNVFQFFIICKRTNNANNATHYVKLGKKRRESSKRNYYMLSPRVIIKAIIIIRASTSSRGDWVCCAQGRVCRDWWHSARAHETTVRPLCRPLGNVCTTCLIPEPLHIRPTDAPACLLYGPVWRPPRATCQCAWWWRTQAMTASEDPHSPHTKTAAMTAHQATTPQPRILPCLQPTRVGELTRVAPTRVSCSKLTFGQIFFFFKFKSVY